VADKPSKAEADRLLYEYERQLDAPKVMSNKFPNITRAIDPLILNKSEEEIYNKLGENTPKIQENALFDWYRKAEDVAGKAVANDYYETNNPLALLEKIKREKNIDFKTQYSPMEGKLGVTYPAYEPDKFTFPKDVMDERSAALADPKLPIPVIALNDRNKNQASEISTAMHEAKHVEDMKNNYVGAQERTFYNPETKQFDYSSYEKYKDKPLYNVSGYISTGHFKEPRSSVINDLINKSKELGAKEGFEYQFDELPKYDELESIKATLKDLEPGYPKHKPMGPFRRLKRIVK